MQQHTTTQQDGGARESAALMNESPAARANRPIVDPVEAKAVTQAFVRNLWAMRKEAKRLDNWAGKQEPNNCGNATHDLLSGLDEAISGAEALDELIIVAQQEDTEDQPKGIEGLL